MAMLPLPVHIIPTPSCAAACDGVHSTVRQGCLSREATHHCNQQSAVHLLGLQRTLTNPHD